VKKGTRFVRYVVLSRSKTEFWSEIINRPWSSPDWS